MCTVSWVHEDDGYRLLCNRDEQRTRREAIEPQHEQRAGVRFLSPIDGERGGTWLSVNEYGLSVCLLNGACLAGSTVTRDGLAPRRSRGEIPLALVDARTALEACARLSRLDLAEYVAFTAVIAEPDLPVAIAEWDGEVLAIIPYGEPYLPLISSSFDAAHVRAERSAEFLRMAQAGDSLESFHRSHGAGPSAYSPCMHRPDAETVSLSEVRVRGDSITLRYSAGAPCRGVPPVERTLERIQ